MTRYACCYLRLPKTLHCSMASVLHTVCWVLFSFIWHSAKVIAHKRTTLPDSFLSASFYLSFGAPQCLQQSSMEVASFVLSLLPLKLCWVISQCSCSRGNSHFCFCSGAGTHPSISISFSENTFNFVYLISIAWCGWKCDHRKCKNKVTPHQWPEFWIPS